MAVRITLASFLFISLCVAISPDLRGQEQKNAAQDLLSRAAQARFEDNPIQAEKQILAAIELMEQTNDPDLARALHMLGGVYISKGEYAQALTVDKRALALDENIHGPESYQVAMDWTDFGHAYDRGGNQAEAEKCYKQSLEISEKLPEPQKSVQSGVLHALGQLYMKQHRDAECEAALKRAFEIAQARPKPNPVIFMEIKQDLARLYRQEGRNKDAEALFAKSDAASPPVETSRQKADIAYILTLQKAEEYRTEGKLESAEAGYRQVIADLEQKGPAQNKAYALYLPQALIRLGELDEAEKRDAEAEDLFKRAIAVREQYASSGDEIALGLTSPDYLVSLYRRQGRLAEAEPVFERAIAIQEKVLGPDASFAAQTMINLAMFYREEGKSEDAVPLYERALTIQEKNWGETPALARSLDQYARLLNEAGEAAQAGAAHERAEAIRKRVAVQNSKP